MVRLNRCGSLRISGVYGDIQQVFRLDMRIVEGILLVDFIDDDFRL